MCERKSRKGGKNPIFINMEILPDVKSLEDTLVHLLARWFKHALSADLKYLECLRCYRQRVLTTKLDKQSATTEDMWLICSEIGDQAGKQT